MQAELQKLVTGLRDQIERFQESPESYEVGTVVQMGDGIARVYGLPGVMSGELVTIEIPGHTTVPGMVLNLEQDSVGIVLFGESNAVREGMTVRRSEQVAQVPVGEALLGRVVDPLGNALDGGPEIITEHTRRIEIKAPGIVGRQNVCEPLQTGMKAIDAMIPIGRGQRELIIGDRRTGKTAIAIDTIINQKTCTGKDKVHCFYVAIGQKLSSVCRVVERLREHGAMEYTTVVCAAASESAPLQYIAPYSGCTMAEYFRDSSRHALIVYDDLTKQAQAYRQLSLLLRRPPGREAFPGDIFYVHSRLLERAAKMSEEEGGGSLTALPIIETQAGDVSAYIPTNVISITDGQIFLEADLFNSGLRPAINVGISVSRVGGDAQVKAMKQTAGMLRLELAQYRELASFSQFSSDLDTATKNQLARGEKLTEILKQQQYHPLDVLFQTMIIYAGTHGYFDEYPTPKLRTYEAQLYSFLTEKHGGFMSALGEAGAFNEELEKQANSALAEFAKHFDPSMSAGDIDAEYTVRMATQLSEPGSHAHRELKHLAKSVTAKQLFSPSFESQLADIVKKREERGAETEAIDKVLTDCTILDIEGKPTLESLFRQGAEIMAGQIDMPADALHDQLMTREKGNTSALTPFLAIPHTIVEGEGKFTIVPVRCKRRVAFADTAPDVHAVFFIACSLDQRRFYLEMLAAIARVVHHLEFGKQWLGAKSVEELRKILLS